MKIDNIKIQPDWSKSKEDIWNEMFSDIEDKSQIKKSILHPYWRYAVASVAAILILLPGIAFLYTKEIDVTRGKHQTALLPDGSAVVINAESKLRYKPLWWYVSRQVELEGEAYFEVEKGSVFEVKSDAYSVQVLGTSFNIYSRGGRYNVHCLTGRVNVLVKNQSVLLTPSMQTWLDGGQLQTKTVEDARQSIDWTQNKFVFIGVSLDTVIEEIERQYNIDVVPNSNLDYIYTGNFTKSDNPREVLQIVGKPFGIEFEIK